MGKMCVAVEASSKIALSKSLSCRCGIRYATWHVHDAVSSDLCLPDCGVCVKKCPFEAISICYLPKCLASEAMHWYGPNSFKLHMLPSLPRPAEVLGLVGTNGIGKSTALKILAGKLMPNFGKFDSPPTKEEILKHFRGSELQVRAA